jgi:nucleoside-diphosphate-sugar epimerase
MANGYVSVHPVEPRIVITGVAGFIGSNLADRLLREGYSVVGVDNLSYGVREQVPPGVEFCEVDIRSPNLVDVLREGDVVFHLAAKNCISDCQADPVDTVSINVFGTVNVFEAVRQRKAQKVIYAESSALYEGVKVLPTPESEIHPESFYAVSKLSGMAFAEAYRRFFNIRTTALRYFCVYGPRQDYRRTIPPVMSAFIIKLLRGEQPVIYGNGQKRRDFVHVDDVNAFHLQCIADPRTEGKVFNLGSGKNYSVGDIYQRVAGILQTDILPLYKPDLSGEAQETLADIELAKSVGWKPTIDLDEGLRRFVEYYREIGMACLA